ncbi:MAG TPA: Calx-beta domain-containing protein, partial [Roseiflexaceae bacterium]|nr:Calx-beta domain-containing protein [Roseiflexaceae bacterium]
MPSFQRAARVFALALLTALLALPRSSAASLAPPTVPAPQATAACGDGWQTVASRVVGFGGTALNDIVALAPDNIWAVGYQTTTASRYHQPLIQHWDGKDWAYVPLEPISDGVLYAITATGPNDVWAAGAIVDSAYNGIEGLILHWNGATWSRVPAPNGALMIRDLDAVAPGTVWGVGYTATQILILRWKNGQSSPVTPPSFGAQDIDPRGIAAISDSDVWISGGVRTAHWNGTQWSMVATPDNEISLYAVAASGSNDVWAVGSNTSLQPDIIHWGGSQWLRATLPQLELSDNVLLGVTALGPNDVWAVGRSTDAAIALHWDGAAWRDASPPRSPLGYEQFRAVAALSTTNVWTAGQLYLGSDQGKTLVKRYAPTVALGGATMTRSGGSGAAAVTVALSSTVPHTVTVAYATSNETAIAGTDYVATSGVLKILPCQRSATFSVPLLDNPAWRPSAVVRLTISNPTGATLATPATTRVNIADYAKAPPGRLAYLPGITSAGAQLNQGRIAYVGVLG